MEFNQSDSSKLGHRVTIGDGVAGAELICTETVMNPMQLVTEDMAPPAADEIQWLFTLRSVSIYIYPFNLLFSYLLSAHPFSYKFNLVTFWNFLSVLAYDDC